MRTLIHYKKISTLLFYLIVIGVGSIVITSCEEDIPEAGSIPDETPPTAGFSYSASSESNLMINFSNLSGSATKFVWDFGDGNTSSEKEPSNQYADFGTYTVKLISSDNLGVTSTVTDEVLVVAGPLQPVISEAGFEDNSARAAGCGDGLDGRDCWRNSDLGGVIQITSDARSGDQAAKLTGSSSDQRIGYQLVKVEAEQNYDLNFFYTMKNDKVGFITVSILSGPASSHEEALTKTIGSVTVNDQTDPDVYEGASVSFNSGSSTEVAVYFFNEGTVESRLDDFSIDIGQAGSVPPSASFSSEQSETNFLEYSFINNSINAESYSWDFGDGNSSIEESPTHTYADAAVYTVTLTATSAIGVTADFSTAIDIQASVTAGFTFQPDANDHRTYSFTDASIDAASLLWEFGDGFQFTGMNPTHTYDVDGIYTVKLTATSVTGLESVATQQITVALGFVVQVLNGTFDEYTSNTGDNADAWDMTPNSTVEDNNGNTIPSPYDPLWDNSDLNAYIDATYCTNEQVGSTSDGNGGTRGAKIGNSCRRLYQVVEVRSGVNYTFSIDSRSEAAGVNTEVFILNTEISDETGIDASTSDAAIDQYFDITNDFNTDGSVFVTSTFTFTPSTDKIVIYVRALGAVDGSNEVFLDNVEITEN